MRVIIMNDVKKTMIAVTIILLCGILAGQVLMVIVLNHFKQAMVAHDYKVAGYLYRNHLNRSTITSAFTAEKTTGDYVRGQALMQAAGYSRNTRNNFLPDVKSFYQNYTILVLTLSVVMALTIFAAFLIFLLRLDRKLEKATANINNFMDGNPGIRLNDNDEGSLAELFSSVNTMATSLTTHIAMEKQRKEFLRDTISDISHQLKTPLAALKMYNEIIQAENNGNDVVDKFVSKSEHEIERMEILIQNLLKLARLDAGTIVLEKQSLNLHDFLEECLKGFQIRAELEMKSFSVCCDHEITLNCDKQWMLEAISNIIKNALDHTGLNDRVDIIGDETSVAIRITIRDNGRGIHPEDIHHIYKRFYRSRFSQDKQGVGIGLTLSKSIIEKHGGSIIAESELGQGTVFHLVFPKLTNM